MTATEITASATELLPPPFAAWFARGFRVHLLGRDRVFTFPRDSLVH